MATVANDPLKERLLSKGLWADFVRMRHDLCASEGLSSAKSAKRVLEQIDPDAVELLNGRGRPMKNGEKAELRQKEKGTTLGEESGLRRKAKSTAKSGATKTA